MMMDWIWGMVGSSSSGVWVWTLEEEVWRAPEEIQEGGQAREREFHF